MIIVTGTKRSGTSLWMQILIAAGYQSFGEAFPRDWGDSIRDANPDGFHESLLRRGIYYATNPHPRTGAYFFHEQVERHVVKVFIPGLIRTDRAYITKVLATMRPWREYAASVTRLYELERSNRGEASETREPPPRLEPALEWWWENFGLIRDIATRRYPVHVQSYDGLLEDPGKVVRSALTWLGGGDADAAVATVNPDRRTQHAPSRADIEPGYTEMFDELYDTIRHGQGLTPAFVAKLNDINDDLAPRIREQRDRVLAHARLRAPVPPTENGAIRHDLDDTD